MIGGGDITCSICGVVYNPDIEEHSCKCKTKWNKNTLQNCEHCEHCEHCCTIYDPKK